MSQKGIGAYKIADFLGIAPHALYPQSKKMEIPMRRGRRFQLDPFKEEIIRLYKSGSTIMALSEKYNCDWATVSKLLRKENISRKNDGIKKEKKRERLIHFEAKIKELYEKKVPYEVIAQTIGVSKIAVRHFIKDRAWTKNKIVEQVRLPNKAGALKGKEKIMCDMYQNGMSIYRIADALKTTPKTVYFKLRKNGIVLRENSFLLDPQKDEIIELYKNGYSIKSIAKKYECCREAVARLLKREGFSRKTSGVKSARAGRLMKLSPIIKKLYDEGYLSKEIAQKIGTTESGICHFIKARGWTRTVAKKKAKTKTFFKKDLIKKLYTQDHLSIPEIARKVELSLPSVRKVLHEMEVQ